MTEGVKLGGGILLNRREFSVRDWSPMVDAPSPGGTYRVAYIVTPHGVVGVYSQTDPDHTSLITAFGGRAYEVAWARSFKDPFLKTLAKRFAAQVAGDRLVDVVMELREADKGDDTGLCLGELIRTSRDAWGLSLQQLADAAGLSKAHVWDLERSESLNPSVKAITGLATALRIPPVHILNAAITSQRIVPAAPKDQPQ